MKFCPSCGEDLSPYLAAEQGHPAGPSVSIQPTVGKYDAVATWKPILATAQEREASPPSIENLVAETLEGIKPGKKKTIVHIAFDREIVPKGGVLYRATLLEGRNEMDEKRFRQMGYAVDEDGHLVVVDDVPVGNLWRILNYWGGVKQHKRWHMKYPIEVNPGRNGDIYFMDNNIVAFGVDWKDTSKMHEAFTTLFENFGGLHGEDAIGVPLVAKLVEQ